LAVHAINRRLLPAHPQEFLLAPAAAPYWINGFQLIGPGSSTGAALLIDWLPT